MAYRPFYDLVSEDTPATFANPATVQVQAAPTVAGLATVAGVSAETEKLETLSAEDERAAYEERAGILEYDCGLPRAEAEHLAGLQTGYILPQRCWGEMPGNLADYAERLDARSCEPDTSSTSRASPICFTEKPTVERSSLPRRTSDFAI
ncbi:hypothetical protein OCUBac02_08110 [Bosea sp. ANAM02]|nr:hypothetical protein OCUBac02_08110 [Bosea sp. ANAM02]